MNGITAACTGRVARGAELRFTAAGKPMCSVSIAIADAKRAEDAPTEWLKVVCFGELADEMAPKLTKGTEVYAEGRLKLNQWAAADGTARSGLELIAWTIQPMGQLGRRRPSPPRDERAPAGADAGFGWEA